VCIRAVLEEEGFELVESGCGFQYLLALTDQALQLLALGLGWPVLG